MSEITEARESVRVEPVYLVEITLMGEGAPVMRFSQRLLEAGGHLYEPYLMDVAGIGQTLARRGEGNTHHGISMRLDNLPWRGYDRLIEAGDEYPFEGAQCLLSECYMVDDGAAGSEPTEVELLCRGILESPTGADLSGFTCGLLSLQYRADIKQ